MSYLTLVSETPEEADPLQWTDSYEKDFQDLKNNISSDAHHQ